MKPPASLRTLALPALALAVTGTLAWAVFTHSRNLPNFTDFEVYYTAARKSLAGATVYDVKGHYQYKYAPFIALLFGAVYGSFSFGTAAWLNYGLTAALWVAWMVMVASRSGAAKTLRAEWLIPLTLLFFTVALRDELKLGQVNAVPALLLAGTYLKGSSHSGTLSRTLARSALLGMAVQFKLYTLIAFPYFVLRRRWEVPLGALVVIGICNFLIVPLHHGFGEGTAETLRWLTTLTASSKDLLDSPHNASILGAALKWSGSPGITYSFWAAATAGFLAAQWRLLNRAPIENLALAGAGIVLLTPLAWPYWVLWLYPPFMVAVAKAPRRPAWAIGAAALSFWYLMVDLNSHTAYYGGPAAAALIALAAALTSAEDRRTRAVPRSSRPTQ